MNFTFLRFSISIFFICRIRTIETFFVENENDDDYLDADSVSSKSQFQFDHLNSTLFNSLIHSTLSRRISLLSDGTIHLNGFSLRQIDSNTFDNCSHLVTTLILSSNLLSNLPTNVFRSFYSTLEHLDLRRNRFYSLKNSSFLHRLEKLVGLDLSENQMKFIEKENFRGLKRLETLIFRKNHLTSISNSTFLHCSSLRTLDLSENHLLFIDSDAFRHLVELKILLLNENPLGKHSITQQLMSPLINLEFLDLENNRIDSLPPFLFIFNQKLQSIKLRRNFFNYSNSLKRTFCGVSSLIEIDLVDTNLHTLDICTYHQIPTLRRLYLMDNPLHCSCDLFYFRYGDIYRVIIEHPTDHDREYQITQLNHWISREELNQQLEKAFQQGNIHRLPIELSILARCATPKEWSGYQLNNLTQIYHQCHQQWNQLDRECQNYCRQETNHSVNVLSSIASQKSKTSSVISMIVLFILFIDQ